MRNLYKLFILELSNFRKQGLEVSDINLFALADKIYDKLYTGKIAKKDMLYFEKSVKILERANYNEEKDKPH